MQVAIGLCLTLIHLIGIPVDNLSVNPARSTGTALFAEPWALQQLWLFWVAPIIGGALGGLRHGEDSRAVLHHHQQLGNAQQRQQRIQHLMRQSHGDD